MSGLPDRSSGTSSRDRAHQKPQDAPKAPEDAGLEQKFRDSADKPGAVPPPPSAPSPSGQTRVDVTSAQLGAIKNIKANTEAREATYKELEAAIQEMPQDKRAGYQKVLKILKTEPEKLSKGGASWVISHAPMTDPAGAPTEDQMERGKAILKHLQNANATRLQNKVKAELPDIFEKTEASGLDDLTKGEMHQLIGVYKAHEKEVAQSPATEEQLRHVTEFLNDPDVVAKLDHEKYGYKGQTETLQGHIAAGTLTQAGVDRIFQAKQWVEMDHNAADIERILPILATLSEAELNEIAVDFVANLEVKAGKTFSDQAKAFRNREIKALAAGPSAPNKEAFKKARYEMLKYENGRKLAQLVEAHTQV